VLHICSALLAWKMLLTTAGLAILLKLEGILEEQLGKYTYIQMATAAPSLSHEMLGGPALC
jgi:hypothetical protein